jgi:ABC-type sugar transport system ATPase subunit
MLGIRPEDVRIGTQGLPAQVAAVEPLGAETVVALDSGGTRLHALISGAVDLAPGASVRLDLPRERLIAFDAAGRRLDGAETMRA